VNAKEWFEDGQNAILRSKLNDPEIVMAMRIVADSIPIPMPAANSKESDIIFAAGVSLGYSMALDNLRRLAAAPKDEEPEARFAAVEE
jgi:hypothetical protein